MHKERLVIAATIKFCPFIENNSCFWLILLCEVAKVQEFPQLIDSKAVWLTLGPYRLFNTTSLAV